MDSFLENCGVRLLEVSVEREGAGPPTVQRFSDRPYFLLGRHPRNDVRLNDDLVSNRHAYLQAVGGRVFCADLGSRTGVHWPSGRRPFGWVDWEEPLRIGKSVLRVSRPKEEAGCATFPSEGDLSAPPAAMRAVFEVSKMSGLVTWKMNRLLALVGAAGECKVRLRDARVSRFHCGLVRGPLGVWVVDLMSRAGTQINGRTVSWGRLEDGDQLQVGPYSLRCLYAPSNGMQVTRLPAPATRASQALWAGSPSYGPPAALDQSLMLPLMTEFNHMQQQMLDQFQQTMLMMAEMFTTLHKEQAGLVREELQHLRKLTSELNALQAEQARQALPTQPQPLVVHSGSVAAAPSVERERPREPEVHENAAEPQTNSRGTAPAPDGMPEEPKKAAEKPAAATVPTDVHDWLSRRIGELQTERQGRWQKLMRMVMGG
jgi:pSer/pThr/pTyr-binding forkhead associated (FHA) protein